MLCRCTRNAEDLVDVFNCSRYHQAVPISLELSHNCLSQNRTSRTEQADSPQHAIRQTTRRHQYNISRNISLAPLTSESSSLGERGGGTQRPPMPIPRSTKNVPAPFRCWRNTWADTRWPAGPTPHTCHRTTRVTCCACCVSRAATQKGRCPGGKPGPGGRKPGGGPP